MAPPLSKESQKLLDGTKSTVKMLADQHKKLLPRWNKMAGGLKQGIADASDDQIAFYRPEFDKVSADVDDAVNTLESALALIGHLRRDQAVMAACFDDVEKLLKTVAPIRKQLLAWVDEARELKKTSEKAAADAKTSSASADADLASLKDTVGDMLEAAEAAVTRADKLEKTARDAFAAGRQKLLTDSRVEMIEIGGRTLMVSLMKPRVEKFRKHYPDLDRDRKAEAQWLLDDLEKMLGWYQDIDKRAKELVKLGQIPPKAPPKPAAKPPAFSSAELAQIGAKLGIDKKDHAKLGKILTDNPRSKWAAEIAKAFKLKESDLKAKLVEVDKLPFVRKSMLIDI